jgi:hypothetical protein
MKTVEPCNIIAMISTPILSSYDAEKSAYLALARHGLKFPQLHIRKAAFPQVTEFDI